MTTSNRTRNLQLKHAEIELIESALKSQIKMAEKAILISREIDSNMSCKSLCNKISELANLQIDINYGKKDV